MKSSSPRQTRPQTAPIWKPTLDEQRQIEHQMHLARAQAREEASGFFMRTLRGLFGVRRGGARPDQH